MFNCFGVLDRFQVVAFAVLYILPGLFILDAGLRPAAAWTQLGRSKLRWVAIFLAAPVLSLWTGSFVPAYVVLPFSVFYMARVRSLLDVTTGLAHDQAGRHRPSKQQQEAMANVFLIGPPLVVLWGAILWTGDTRERVAVSVIAGGGLALLGFYAFYKLRRQ